MRYVWVKGRDQQKMHIQVHDQTGRPLMKSLCGSRLPFNRSINAPWTLGKGLCKNCQKRAARAIAEHNSKYYEDKSWSHQKELRAALKVALESEA